MTQTGIVREIFLSVINLYFMSNKELRANAAQDMWKNILSAVCLMDSV